MNYMCIIYVCTCLYVSVLWIFYKRMGLNWSTYLLRINVNNLDLLMNKKTIIDLSYLVSVIHVNHTTVCESSSCIFYVE